MITILQYGADINDRAENVCAPLERGADVHARDRLNKTPLELASDSGHGDIAQLLVKYGAR